MVLATFLVPLKSQQVTVDPSGATTVSERVFRWAEHLTPNDAESDPIKSIITKGTEAAVVAWTVAPGQRLPAHRHPNGQDT